MLDFKRYKKVAVFSVLPIIGIVALLVGTRLGIGANDDSSVYACAAGNFLKGQGLSVVFPSGEIIPVRHFPPLFSTLLAGGMAIGADPLDVARGLNVLLFGANILMVGLLINAYSRSLWISLFGAFLTLTSIAIIYVHSMALSEPLFIFLGFFGLYLVAVYLRDERLSILIFASIFIALAFFSRYVGGSLVITGLIGILFYRKKIWKGRFIDAAIFFLISCLPMILWGIRSIHVSYLATFPVIILRKIAFHPVTIDHLKGGIEVITGWLLPGIIPISLRLVIIAVAFGFFSLYLRLKQKKIGHAERDFTEEQLPRLLPLLLIFILIYVASLIISISFIDALVPLNSRLLSPVYIAALIFSLCIFKKKLLIIKRSRNLFVICIISLTAFSVLSLYRTAIFFHDMYSNGLGYNSKTWRQSEIIEKVRNLNPKIPVLTNNPASIYILTGKITYLLPLKVNPCTRITNNNYLSELFSMRTELENRNGVVVYFKKAPELSFPLENELQENLSLYPIFKGTDGVIYKVKD